MSYVTVGEENSTELKLYYEDHGAGDPVILIHGYPLCTSSWERQVPALLKAGKRVIAYDRRGFGKSHQPATGYDYDTFTQDLSRLIEALELEKVTLVGFSMGGGEVVRYIGRYGAAKISKAVIIGGVPPYLIKTSETPEGVDASAFRGIAEAVAADRYAFFTQFFQNFFNADQLLGSRVSEEVLRACWNVAALSSPIADVACVATWHEDFRKDVAKVTVPTLVIHGDSDRIVPLAASGAKTAELIRGAKLHVVKGGPHCITWTHADEVNEALLSFLR